MGKRVPKRESLEGEGFLRGVPLGGEKEGEDEEGDGKTSNLFTKVETEGRIPVVSNVVELVLDSLPLTAFSEDLVENDEDEGGEEEGMGLDRERRKMWRRSWPTRWILSLRALTSSSVLSLWGTNSSIFLHSRSLFLFSFSRSLSSFSS